MSSQQKQDDEVSTLHDWGAAVHRRYSRRMHTFDPRTLRGNKLMKLHSLAKRTLGSGDMSIAVQLPPEEDVNEWLAMHIVDFYNEITLLYAFVAEFDTEEKFPVMGAGKNKYLWADNTTVEPLKLSAPAYVNRLFTWIEDQLDDENIFPTSMDQPFPSNFKARVSRIFRRLFRVYAHIYYNHFDYIVGQKAEAHMNSCFKHFVLFSHEFCLVDNKEMEPLKYVVEQLLGPLDASNEKSKRKSHQPRDSGADSEPYERDSTNSQPRENSDPTNVSKSSSKDSGSAPSSSSSSSSKSKSNSSLASFSSSAATGPNVKKDARTDAVNREGSPSSAEKPTEPNDIEVQEGVGADARAGKHQCCVIL